MADATDGTAISFAQRVDGLIVLADAHVELREKAQIAGALKGVATHCIRLMALRPSRIASVLEPQPAAGQAQRKMQIGIVGALLQAACIWVRSSAYSGFAFVLSPAAWYAQAR